MTFREYCIGPNALVQEAMKRLDVIKPKILFVVDGDLLLGSLTDGDVRRFLLASGKLDDVVTKACQTTPLCARNEAEAASLYSAKNYVAIPIINEKGEITDIFLGESKEEAHATDLGIPVVINAGGKGTRLDLFTKVLPKPLIPIGDYPIIEHIMRRFREFGCDVFDIIVNYKKQLIKAYFSESENPYNISWYDEEKPLGTGGGLCFLKGKLDKTFFFTNCDILITEDYEKILKFHKEKHNAITMVCAYKNVLIPYGVIEIGEDGFIEEMKEKPELSFLTNTGMYLVEPEVLDIIEDNVSIGFPDVIKKAMAKGMKVSAYPISGENWMDMGQLPELEKMYERFAK